MYLKLSVAGHLTIFLTRSARPILVHQAREDSLDRGSRNASHRNLDCGVRSVYDASRLGLGGICMGLRRVVPA